TRRDRRPNRERRLFPARQADALRRGAIPPKQIRSSAACAAFVIPYFITPSAPMHDKKLIH
ncbi:hypothetical protein AAHH78_37565, partial [Burkholderia pseudomallei]